MQIRKGTPSDYIHIVRSIQNKHIEYITPQHIKEDINNERLYLLEENNKIIGSISLVYDSQYKYYAMKRLCIYNKKNCGKGYAYMLLAYLTNTQNKIGCTPWINNEAMKHMLSKLGYKLQYIFNEKWCFYLKEALYYYQMFNI